MLNFLELVKERYSCRAYKETEIPKEKLNYIFECARLAPSACNNQPVRIMVVEKKKEEVIKYCGVSGKWLASAPCILVILTNTQAGWVDKEGHSTSEMDATIVADHITLAATSVGLATCWVKGYDKIKCKEILNIPENYEIVTLLALGFADSEARRDKQRISIEEFVVKMN